MADQGPPWAMVGSPPKIFLGGWPAGGHSGSAGSSGCSGSDSVSSWNRAGSAVDPASGFWF